jgi:glycosyltransferase involved in cell wall biosynthesis
MQILHLYAGNLFGGIETFLITLAQQQHLCPEMEHHFGLCFEGRLSSTLQASQAPVNFLGNVRFSRPWTVWQARRRLAKLLQTIRFDVVICHACWPQAVFGPVVKAQNLPLVFFAHNVLVGNHWLDKLAKQVIPTLALANSQFTLTFLNKFYPTILNQHWYLPVAEPANLLVNTSLSQEIRNGLQTPDNAVVILLVARIEALKGHKTLISALARLKQEDNWVCWIVGGAQRPHEVDFLEQLRFLAFESGYGERIHFLGQRTDIPSLMAVADIYCQPNLEPESFGIAFIEALYAGLPVVTTAIGGGLEIVTPDCGRLVPPCDAETLANQLQELIQRPDLRASLGNKGRERAKDLCDPQTQLSKLNQLLTEIAK